MRLRPQPLFPAYAFAGFVRMLDLDSAVLVRLGRKRSPAMTRLMKALTACGNTESWLVHAAALTVLAPFGGRATGLLVATAALFATAVVQPLKRVVKRRRPRVEIRGIEALSSDPDMFSFPSGHSAVAFAVATALAPLHPALAAAEFVLAGGIAFSRMYLGAHYPLDVCVGAAIGILCGLATGLLPF